jgi:hypothetical protein
MRLSISSSRSEHVALRVSEQNDPNCWFIVELDCRDVTAMLKIQGNKFAVREDKWNDGVDECVRGDQKGLPRTLSLETADSVVEILLYPLRVKPADLVVRSPELGGLVDIDLASLLRVRLAELLRGELLRALQAADENAPLAREICGAVQAETSSETQLVGVEEMSVGVLAQVESVALPVNLEAVGLVGQRAERRAVILQSEEVLVLAVGRNRPHSWLWCGTDADSLANRGWCRPNWPRPWCLHLSWRLGLLDPRNS